MIIHFTFHCKHNLYQSPEFKLFHLSHPLSHIYNFFKRSGKTIHVFNKNEHAIDMAAPIHDEFGNLDGSDVNGTFVKDRTNILLLGDGLGDLGMSDGVSFENRIAVGFL